MVGLRLLSPAKKSQERSDPSRLCASLSLKGARRRILRSEWASRRIDFSFDGSHCDGVTGRVRTESGGYKNKYM